MKEYKCTWIDETGEFHVLDYKTTDNPKMFLFDVICKTIVSWGAIFKTDGMPNKIASLIKTGKADREHYFTDINGQVLSVIEMNYKQTEVQPLKHTDNDTNRAYMRCVLARPCITRRKQRKITPKTRSDDKTHQ